MKRHEQMIKTNTMSIRPSQLYGVSIHNSTDKKGNSTSWPRMKILNIYEITQWIEKQYTYLEGREQKNRFEKKLNNLLSSAKEIIEYMEEEVGEEK